MNQAGLTGVVPMTSGESRSGSPRCGCGAASGTVIGVGVCGERDVGTPRGDRLAGCTASEST